MFGATGTEQPAAAPPRSSTQMFGAAGTEQPAAAPPRSSTQMFGAPTDASDDTDDLDEEPKPPDRASSTMIFGNPFAERPPEQPAPPKPAPLPRVPMSKAGSSTMIFGRPDSLPTPEPTAPADATPEVEPPPEIPRQERTMRFGLADIEAAHKAKQAEMAEKAAAEQQPPPKRTASIEVDMDFDAPTTPLGTPSAASVEVDPAAYDAASEPTQPPSTPLGTEAAQPSVELPPERPMPTPIPLELTAPEPEAQAEEDGFKVYSPEPKRSYGWVFAVLVLAVLAVAGYVGAKEWQRRKAQIPTDVQARLLSAQTLLRADDTSSLNRASVEFDGIANAYPTWREPRAWQAITLAFELDDANVQLALLRTQSTALNARIAKLQDEKSPADWQNRINAMQDELDALKKTAQPLNDAATKLNQQLTAALDAASASPTDQSKEDQLAVARAHMLVTGINGLAISDAAQTYRDLGGANGWDAIATAEYALNRKDPQPSQLNASLGAMQALRQSDSTFIRTHLLASRLAAAAAQKDVAQAAAETAVALNPEHQVARVLLNSLQQSNGAQ